MPTLHTYDYAVIRVVPRVEREEFINVGVIVSCPGAKHLQAAIEIDPVRMQAFAPSLDLEALQPWLDAIVAICRGMPPQAPSRSCRRERGSIFSLPSAVQWCRCRARTWGEQRTRKAWWSI